MQGQSFKTSGSAGSGVRVVGFRQAAGGAGGAEKHPFIAAGQSGQQVQHVRRCRYFAGAFHLVPNADALPLRVHILPAQRQHFAGPGTGQQHHLNAGRNDRGLKLLHGGKPCGQLAFLQPVLLGASLAQCLAGFLGFGGVLGW